MNNLDLITKRCTACGEIKPVSQFHRAASGRDGLRAACKDCGRAAALAYQASAALLTQKGSGKRTGHR